MQNETEKLKGEKPGSPLAGELAFAKQMTEGVAPSILPPPQGGRFFYCFSEIVQVAKLVPQDMGADWSNSGSLSQ